MWQVSTQSHGHLPSAPECEPLPWVTVWHQHNVTYGVDHAAVLLGSPTAAEEPDDEDHHPHSDEDEGGTGDVEFGGEEGEVVAVVPLDDGAQNDDHATTYLAKEIVYVVKNMSFWWNKILLLLFTVRNSPLYGRG